MTHPEYTPKRITPPRVPATEEYNKNAIFPAPPAPPAIEVRVRVYCVCGEQFLVVMPALLGRGTVDCLNCEKPITFSWHEHGAD